LSQRERSGSYYELADDFVYRCREYCDLDSPSLALVVESKALPTMQRFVAQVEFLGLERGMDLQPVRLQDPALGCNRANRE
jgi:hypothetical protein